MAKDPNRGKRFIVSDRVMVENGKHGTVADSTRNSVLVRWDDGTVDIVLAEGLVPER